MHGKPNSYREFFLKKWADYVVSNEDWSVLQAKFINAQIKNIKSRDFDPQLKPDYIQKLNRIEKENGISFKSIEDLRKRIEEE